MLTGDYNDYDEVTIPPNLTDLLANLPDDISSDSIQKMLRDSVDNPKALLAEFGKLMKNKKLKPDSRKYRSRNLRELKPGDLRSGEKIDQIEVDWTSTRRRDVPVVPEFDGNTKYDKPMLAGQLLIFDLDEEPPSDVGLQKATKNASSQSACSISKNGLLAVIAGFGALLSALIAIIAFLIIRLKSQASPIGQTTPIFKQFQDSVDNPKALLAEFGKLMKNKKLKPDSRKYRSRNLRELKPGDLRSGEKIDQIEVDWTSTRRRDVPVVNEFDGNTKYDKPMLAGQLLIFDLDEEPPSDVGLQKATKNASSQSACSISKDGLLAVIAGFGALLSALIAIIAFLIIRLKSQASPIGQTTPIFKQFQYAQKRFFESSS
ncbi:hypothetical protein CAEBREN_13328 [Caenorhabditis brenneri]|uniref:Uncharacterized protein n=1 Tax=Caenorhabditis brenneri TaxID=135651 RepID=G0NLN0_CAEBE|nr:hypothetical protein CAEBREN_13328 [Caenorhabditis brenneri]